MGEERGEERGEKGGCENGREREGTGERGAGESVNL